MDKLLKAATYYSDNLEGKKFLLRAGKKGQILELDISFSAEHFKHLMGLHKLKDLPVIQKNSSKIVYKRILNNQIAFDDISRSEYFSEMADRLDSFHRIKDTLFSPGLMLKSSKGTFKSISADFLLAKKNNSDENAHLFLKNSKEGITVPVTFFERQDYEYFRLNSGRWTVLSVDEVKKDEEKREEKSQSDAKANKQVAEQSKDDKVANDKLDVVACIIEQCGAKIDVEIAQLKRTQKEIASQQVLQVGQVKQKAKTNNGSSCKR